MQANPWFSTPVKVADPKWRLFCFPYAGGGGSVYFKWARAWAAEQVQVLAVQYPGRESRIREAALTQMPEMVRQLVVAVEPYLSQPCVFYGHSMGAVVAYELTLALRALGRAQPRWLFVSGRNAPGFHVELPSLLHLSDMEMLQKLKERYGGISDEVMREPDLVALLAPMLRADLTLLENHQPEVPDPPLELAITAFGGEGDRLVSAEALAGWGRCTNAPFRSLTLSGDHFFLNTQFEKIWQEMRLDLRGAL